jgi:hypothetical protein
MKRLKVTNTRTGKIWTADNHQHSWRDLCLEIMKDDKDFHLIWCDIECIAKGAGLFLEGERHKECWYMLDECGRYEMIPDHYKIEEVN